MGFFSDLFGGSDDVDVPEFKTNPRIGRLQDILEGFGTEGLQGEFPAYYSTIGQVGSSELEEVIRRANSNIEESVLGNLARRNVGRGGSGTATLAKALADNESGLRLVDYDRALTGRQNLLNLALNTLSNTRNAAQAQQAQENQYALQGAGLELQQNIANKQFSGDIIGGLIGAGGLIGGEIIRARSLAELLGNVSGSGNNALTGLARGAALGI